MDISFQMCMLCLISLVPANTLPTASTGCDQPSDIVFLLDTSSSIWPHDFDSHVLPFLSEVVNMFDIGNTASHTRVGLVTFSDTHQLQFNLGDVLDKKVLKERILDTPFYGGNTNTGEALHFATSEMFTDVRGSRPDVAHIIIILTDGTSQDYQATQEAAREAQEKNFQVFAIGVGSRIDNRELEVLASNPDADFKFKVTNFEALMKIKGKLAKKTCAISTVQPSEAPSTTPMSSPLSTSTTQVPHIEPIHLESSTGSANSGFLDDEDIRTQICGGKPADIYFILDSSGSIEQDDFSVRTLDFVRSVTGLFDIGPGRSQTRVGIVTFSDVVTQVVPLNAHTSRGDLMKAISPDNIPHMAQGTNTAAAIRFVQEEGFSSEVSRPEVAHISIVITDGQSKDTEATMEAAKQAQLSGTLLFAIGIGKSIDTQELKGIGSNPDSQFVFTVDDFAALSQIQSLLAIRTCGVINPDVQPNDQAACSMDKAELVFVFDSFAMGLKSTRLIVNEVSHITSRISRRVEDLASGMVSKSCPSRLDIPVRDAVKFARQTMQMQDALAPRLANLMKDARRKWFSRAHTSGRHVMVLVIDGTSLENDQDLLSQSRYARHSGIEVFVVALGDVGSKLVDSLASEPRDDHVIHVPSAKDFSKYSSNIVENLCGDHLAPQKHHDKPIALSSFPPIKVH